MQMTTGNRSAEKFCSSGRTTRYVITSITQITKLTKKQALKEQLSEASKMDRTKYVDQEVNTQLVCFEQAQKASTG